MTMHTRSRHRARLQTFALVFVLASSLQGMSSLATAAPGGNGAGKGAQRLTVRKAGDRGGLVSSDLRNIDCGKNCFANYRSGTVVTLVAVPNPDAVFAGWSGACSGTGACQVTMDDDRDVTATFMHITYTLSVARDGTGGGTVSSDPAGVDCGATCSVSLDEGTVVTLTASPDATSLFSGWSGDCSGSSCQVTMDRARSTTATFTRITHGVTVQRTEGGTVTSDPAGLECGSTCAATFDAGTVVTLTATPASGASFAGWTGDCSGRGTCQVTMDGAKAATARFVYPLTVDKAGTGGGTLTTDPAGIDCGAICAMDVEGGASVMVTAGADEGSIFAGWSGACSGSASTCQVTMNGPSSVTATFNRTTYDLTVQRTQGGSVTSSPAGISCGSTCTGAFDPGTVVTLTATADSGASFGGWTGVCAGTFTCQVTMDAAKTVGARFTHRLSITRTSYGTVTSSPAGIGCAPGGTVGCVANFDVGTVVTLTATPAGGAVLVSWFGTTGCAIGDPCNDNPRSVTMDINKNLGPQWGFPLTITRSGTGSGTVTSSGGGIAIDCGTTCSANAYAGSTVTLTATPDANSVFTGWSGGGCSGTGTCQVAVNQSRTATAKFDTA